MNEKLTENYSFDANKETTLFKKIVLSEKQNLSEQV